MAVVRVQQTTTIDDKGEKTIAHQATYQDPQSNFSLQATGADKAKLVEQIKAAAESIGTAL